jgi:hypothetical protein
VTCGWPAVVQSEYRFARSQLGVKVTWASIPARIRAGWIGQCRPADLLNCYLLALQAADG